MLKTDDHYVGAQPGGQRRGSAKQQEVDVALS